MARALLQDAPVLILDEPTAGLDAEAAQQLVAPLRAIARDRATLLITHDPVAGRGGRRDRRPGRRPCAMKGYETLAHLNRSNRYDTYEVWSEERQCSCVAKRPRPDASRPDRGGAAAGRCAAGGRSATRTWCAGTRSSTTR